MLPKFEPNEVAQLVLANLGLICWSINLIPQAIQIYRTKNVGVLSSAMLLIWISWAPTFGALVFSTGQSWPILLQPNLFGFFNAICYAQYQYYGPPKRSLAVSVTIFFALLATIGGAEVALYFAAVYSAASKNSAVNWFPTALGILPTVQNFVSFAPQYYNIYIHKTTHGISRIFLVLDCLGGVFSIFALFCGKNEVDPFSFAVYASVCLLTGGILCLSIAFTIRDWRAGRRASHSPVAASDPLEPDAHQTEADQKC
ncbi:hypothetical protein BJ742DRAFT_783202 [Cladochytrium replicatum]|nr:hypothetical protein BJ742DRAFT_783202 [Cladochytrium replicatum]